MTMSERPFLSIGEVLDYLKDDFPDVTISKIRFLESQGLLAPERTPSGYRKFYEADVARLRWILEQQREHFLPLKVIKERIAAIGVEADPAPIAEPTPAPRRSRPPAPAAADAVTALAGMTGVSMTLAELSNACGLEVAEVQQLERVGLLTGEAVAGQTYYDEDALIVANMAAAMIGHGVEPRHLRMYKTAADREASTYEQLVLPLLKQRNPAARQQAAEVLADLAQLGEGLRAALVRSALRQYSG
jgi:DNA-binding transcriptional MerR regulator